MLLGFLTESKLPLRPQSREGPQEGFLCLQTGSGAALWAGAALGWLLPPVHPMPAVRPCVTSGGRRGHREGLSVSSTGCRCCPEQRRRRALPPFSWWPAGAQQERRALSHQAMLPPWETPQVSGTHAAPSSNQQTHPRMLRSQYHSVQNSPRLGAGKHRGLVPLTDPLFPTCSELCQPAGL